MKSYKTRIFIAKLFSMKQHTCFLIDDDEDDRDIFMMALNNADDSYECVVANNGLDAVTILTADTQFNPSFVFIDLNMPYMSGKECLAQIKKDPRFLTTPVIMYTTSSYSRDVEDTKDLGAAHFLVKPPGISSLTSMLSDILKQKELPYYINADE